MTGKLLRGNIAIFLILLFALAVRLWGINFGLPQKQIIDEESYVYWTLYAANNHGAVGYIKGPFISYLLLLPFSAYYFFGKIAGSFKDPTGFLVSYLSDPTALFILGRILMALFGTATVFITYLIGNKFFSRRVGLSSAFFLSFAFIHVKESHYIKEDVPMTFFLLISFYFILRVLEKGGLRNYLLSGVFTGLAFSAKQSGILILPLILFAHYFQNRLDKLKLLFFFGISATLTYLLTNPYFLVNPEGAIQKFNELYVSAHALYQPTLDGMTIRTWYFREAITQGVGGVLFWSGFAGFLICLNRFKKEKKYLFIPLLPIIFFITLPFWTRLFQARYALPAIPFFVLGAGIFLDALARSLPAFKKEIFTIPLIAFIIVWQSFLRVIKFDYAITREDTRTLAKGWIEANIPRNSSIFVEGTVQPEYPSGVNPALPLSEEAIQKRIVQTDFTGVRGDYLRALKSANFGKVGYDILAGSRRDVSYNPLNQEISEIHDFSYFRNLRIKYLALSSWALSPEIIQAYKINGRFNEESVYNDYSLVKEFKPTVDFSSEPHFIRMDYNALDKVNFFDGNFTFGPQIKIYRLK